MDKEKKTVSSSYVVHGRTDRSAATRYDALQGLRLLATFRTVTPIFQTVTLLVVVNKFQIDVPSKPVIYLLMLEVLVATATLLRLRIMPKVTALELLLQVNIDIGMFTVMLYLTGGSTNPFAPLYMLPVMIVAVALPACWVWLTAISTMVWYAVLRDYHAPINHPEGHDQVYHLHENGMIVNYALTAAMLVYFCNRLLASLRRQARLAREAQEAAMRSESVGAIGALAAGTAHELGSPLATVAVIAAELMREYPSDQRLQRDLHLIDQQMQACKKILVKMTNAGDERRAETANGAWLDDFMQATVERLRMLNPGATILARLDEATPPPFIVVEETLRQAIANLIQNAVHVSSQHVEVTAAWSGADLVVTVSDRGPGFDAEALRTLGKQPATGRSESGLGLGLLLGAEMLKRLGGSLALANGAAGGASVQLRVPLASLLIDNRGGAAHAAAAC